MLTAINIVAQTIVKILFATVWRIRVTGERTGLARARPPLIIAANHKSVLDHFIIGAALPWRTKLLPLRFLGETQHFSSRWLNVFRALGGIKIFYALFGVVPVLRQRGLNVALAAPLAVLRSGGTVVIYPEGKIIHHNVLGEFKRGIGALAHWSRAPLLPISIRKSKYGIRSCFVVRVGRPFFLPKDLSFEDGADYMRRTVWKLFSASAAEQ